MLVSLIGAQNIVRGISGLGPCLLFSVRPSFLSSVHVRAGEALNQLVCCGLFVNMSLAALIPRGINRPALASKVAGIAGLVTQTSGATLPLFSKGENRGSGYSLIVEMKQ